MAGDGEDGSAAGVAAVQRRRGAPVVFGHSGGVLKHEGEEKKVRGMATWPEGLRRRRSLERGKDSGGNDNPGGGSSALVAGLDEKHGGCEGGASRSGERRGREEKVVGGGERSLLKGGDEVSRGGVVRVPCGSGEDEGGHLARRTEEVGAGGRAARQGWARAGEGSK
jgi:hypothetical protein